MSKEYELQIINNLHNIKEGMVIKNYKELCKVFGMEVKRSGSSKKSQMKNIDRFIKYEKEGNSFIVKEVYEEPLEIVDGRLYSKNVAEYIEDLELLMLDLMFKHNDGYLNISKSKLKEALSMVNLNYNHYYASENRGKLAQELDVDMRIINEYYQSANSILNNALDTVLSRLERKKLIIRTDKVMIVKVEELGTNLNKRYVIEATDEDKMNILKVEREVLVKLGLHIDSKYNSIIASGKYHKFTSMVNDMLYERFDIKYYYKMLQIGFHKPHIAFERNLLLKPFNKYELKNLVNNKIEYRLGRQSVKDYIKSLNFIKEYIDIDVSEEIYLSEEELELLPYSSHKLKLMEGYLSSMKKINSKLIPLHEPLNEDR